GWSGKDKARDHTSLGTPCAVATAAGAPLRAASNRVPRTAHSVTRRIPFHLNRDVPDPHAAQALLHGLEHALVVAGVLDHEVAAHRNHAARDRPDMQVVD